MLENDRPLEGFAMVFVSHGPQKETKRVPEEHTGEKNNSQRPLGVPRALLKSSASGFGVSKDAARAPQSSPGVLWGVFWEALGVSWGAFLLIFSV